MVVGTVPMAACLHCPTVDPDVLAANTEWPLVAVAVAVAAAVCLWGLFRRGSIADRARTDDRHEPAEEPPTDVN